MTLIMLKIKESGEVILQFTTDGSEIHVHTLDKEYMLEIE